MSAIVGMTAGGKVPKAFSIKWRRKSIRQIYKERGEELAFREGRARLKEIEVELERIAADLQYLERKPWEAEVVARLQKQEAALLEEKAGIEKIFKEIERQRIKRERKELQARAKAIPEEVQGLVERANAVFDCRVVQLVLELADALSTSQEGRLKLSLEEALAKTLALPEKYQWLQAEAESLRARGADIGELLPLPELPAGLLDALEAILGRRIELGKHTSSIRRAWRRATRKE